MVRGTEGTSSESDAKLPLNLVRGMDGQVVRHLVDAAILIKPIVHLDLFVQILRFAVASVSLSWQAAA
jgi:hypothetical protein